MLKIKVCHIITKLELGGAQQNTLYTLSHLNQEKFIPVLISGRGGVLDEDAFAMSGVKVYFTDGLVRQIRPWIDVAGFFKLWLLIRKEKPDIVHTHSSKAGIIGRWAAWFAGVPVIIHTFHGFGFHDFQNWVVRLLYIWIERITARITDKLIAVADNNIEKGLAESIGSKEKYIVIRSGIDTQKYKSCRVDKKEKKAELKIDAEQKVVTTIGPFKPQKNLTDFIKAAKQVCSKYTSCSFLVVGDGKQRPQLESLIENLEMTDKIRLLGWRRDIKEILAVSDVFVLTSLWEGLPRSILEAMCLGLPVVANSVDGVSEVVRDGETGFLTEPSNIDSSSESILKLLNNEGLSQIMGANGRELIDKQYDINHMVNQQEQLYLDSIASFT